MSTLTLLTVEKYSIRSKTSEKSFGNQETEPVMTGRFSLL